MKRIVKCCLSKILILVWVLMSNQSDNIANAKYQNVIDVDDILSVDFMPGSLLMLENPEESIKSLTNSSVPIGPSYHHHHQNANGNGSAATDGSIKGALNTMFFHRSKMNEYLCRNFIAEQIIEDMSITRIKKRHGGAEKRQKNMNTTLGSNHKGFTLRDNLIEDEGSSQYKSWLTKSTTLEDIYKHYQDVERRHEDQEEEEDEDPEEEEQYDHHIAGYSYTPQHPGYQLPVGPAKLGHSGHSGHSGPGISYPSSGGYSYGAPPSGGHAPVHYSGHAHAPVHYSGHEHAPVHSVPSNHGYGYSSPPLTHHGFDDHVTVHHQHHTEVHEVPKYHGGHDSGGKDLSELFETALTALAYLSFGMFIIHVVMCISHGKGENGEQQVVLVIPASSTTGTVGTAMGMGMGGDGGMTGDGGGMSENGAGMTGSGGDGGDDGGDGGEDGENGGDDGGNGGDDGDDGGNAGDNAGDGGDDEGDAGNNGGDGGDIGGDGGNDEGDGGDDGGDGGDDGGDGGGGGDDGGDDGGGGGDNGGDDGDGGDGGDGDNGNGNGDGDGDGGDAEPTDEEGDGDDGLDAIRFPFVTSTHVNRPFRKPLIRIKPKKGPKRIKKAHKLGGGGMGEAATTGAMRFRRRRKRRRKRVVEPRDMPSLSNPSMEGLNELARHVLTSIEAALVAHQDDGVCLRKVLCQNNRYSRSSDNSNKMWIPVWSLGMSWLSGKLTKNIPRATSMLDNLKASVLGLGKANCEIIFQDCDLQAERNKRRRRRRKK